MIITEEFLKSLNPCHDGLEYWIKTNKPDLGEFMLQCVHDDHWDWAWWLLKRTVSPRFLVQVAIFSAKSVLHIFEKKYPNDDQVKTCIEITEKFIDGRIEKAALLRARENANAAAYAVSYSAAYAAYAAAYAAKAAYADAAVDAADAAAYAAVDAAYAAGYAAAYANANAVRKNKRLEIVDFVISELKLEEKQNA